MSVLIIGRNSYISLCFQEALQRTEQPYDCISVRDDEWKSFDYSRYHTIVYFASIVHHPEIIDEKLYHLINVEIPHTMASLCKSQGVKHFIYISSVAVWGIGPRFGKKNIINDKTPLSPISLYGKSKLEAERTLLSLMGNDFIVSCVRLPNVYGEDCPGSFYHTIVKLSKFPILPIYFTQYGFSLISVNNVATALQRIIADKTPGIIVPQDPEIIPITQRIKQLAKFGNRRQWQIYLFAPLFWFINQVCPNKYLNNLYGGYYLDPSSLHNPLSPQ